MWGEVRSKRGRWGIRVRQRKTDRLENVLDSLVLLTSANDVIDGRQIKTVFSFHLMDKEFEITGGPRKTGARDRLWRIEVKREIHVAKEKGHWENLSKAALRNMCRND